MKKQLLFICFSFVFALGAAAQCTPDPIYTSPGIYPDSVTNLPAGNVGVAYSGVITAVVPPDTCAQVLPAPLPCTTLSMDSVVVTSVTGLPSSLSFVCGVPGCAFLGGTTGCAVITGTPQPGDEGTHNLVINLNAYAGGAGIPLSYQITYYKVEISGPVSVNEANASLYLVDQNRPNPFNDYTLIEVESPRSEMVSFEVYNIIGERVHAENISLSKGKNTIRFDAAGRPSGTYLYKISDGRQQLTRRMVINH